MLHPNAWQKGYAKAALWSISNPYAYRLTHEKNEKGEVLFTGRDGQPLIGIEASARVDNPHSIDALLNSGADIQDIPETAKPVKATDLAVVNQLPEPLNSRFVFFQPAKNFTQGEPKCAIPELLPNATRLATKP